MCKPDFLIVDGGTGLEQALVALWDECRPSAAPSIGTATYSPTRLSACTT
jgi:hypothetical protein